jgi:hypothetical protein
MFKSGTSTFLDKLNKYEELGRKPKDTLVIADSKELAEEIKQNMIDEAELAGHNDTGTMENSFSVRPAGGGDYAVKGVDYTKYVNGRDREQGEGFVDVAVNSALLDLGGDAEVII